MPTEKVLVLRTCKSDMTSYGGFQWPTSGHVSAPDWYPEPKCGQGLHGFLWGDGDGSLASFYSDARWLVLEVDKDSIVDLGGKVKFPAAKVIFVGDRYSATNYLANHGGHGRVIIGGMFTSGDRGTSTSGDGGTSTSGYGGTSTSGNRGTSTSGDYGTSTSGHRGTSTSGDYGTSTSGNRGTSTSGVWGMSTSGDDGTSTSGVGGKSKSGHKGIIQIYYWGVDRRKLKTGHVGEDGILPNVTYKLNKNRKFVAVETV